MMFKKIAVFKKRPIESLIPLQLQSLSASERTRKVDAILAACDKPQVEHWLTMDRMWSFGDLQPAHPQLYSANAVISAIIDLWPGKDYYSLRPYFIAAKDWEVSILHAFALFLGSDDDVARSIAGDFSFGPDHFDIRSELVRQQVIWEDFEPRAMAYIQAAEAYRRGTDNVHPVYETLKRMHVPDVVLWHEIVTSMGHLNADRVKAIEWILSQPKCDLGTAATFLHVGIEFSMWEELQTYGGGEFERLLTVIERWNAGFYRSCNLSPDDPGNDVHVDTAKFPAMYKAFWQDICPREAALLPIPEPRPLGKPRKSEIRAYSKPSGFAYDAEHEALIYKKGRPQKRSYFTMS
ncbi:MAG: hypothetical protein GVY31_12680 [Alphaproteobacteria bacterium]|jgi:hypothetical protein|nr:hypothetical protein [Alphaproteobacteria bacterium]